MPRRLLLATLLSIAVAMLAAGSAVAVPPAYVALGDSYASGDGTGVYYASAGSCYRSPDAYPPLLAAARGYALSFSACSGAKTGDVVSGQLGALSASTALVTVQVGGDDAGFTTVMEDCAVFYFPCSGAISKADAYIENTLPGELNVTYSAIRAAAPNAEVIVVGYPYLFTSGGRTCGFNLLTSSHEQAIDQTGTLLDGVIASAAAAHGFRFLDPRAAFSAHEICSASPWLNNDTLPIQESYHPNIAGEAAYASLLEGAL